MALVKSGWLWRQSKCDPGAFQVGNPPPPKKRNPGEVLLGGDTGEAGDGPQPGQLIHGSEEIVAELLGDLRKRTAGPSAMRADAQLCGQGWICSRARSGAAPRCPDGCFWQPFPNSSHLAPVLTGNVAALAGGGGV